MMINTSCCHTKVVKKLRMFWQNQLIDTLFFSVMALLFNSFGPTIKGFPRIITVKNFVWPKVIPALLWHITSYPRYADQSFHVTAHNVYDQQYAPSFPVATQSSSFLTVIPKIFTHPLITKAGSQLIVYYKHAIVIPLNVCSLHKIVFVRRK